MLDILLSTYNSSRYLNELMNSLFLQTFSDWKLIIRDDLSQDNTPDLLKNFKKKDPKRIIIIDNNGHHLGPKKSFEELLKHSTSDYIMFCDHDDYWLSTKVQVSLTRMKQLEPKYPQKAVLVCTDLALTDEKLNLIHRSFWKYAKINPNNIFDPYKLSINNPVVGCTVMINRLAKDVFLPIPDSAIMHDWWMALKISEKGIVDYIKKPTILYRQHPANKIGVEKADLHYFTNKFINGNNTFRQNQKAYRMLKTANKKYNLLTFIYYKIGITLSKLLKR